MNIQALVAVLSKGNVDKKTEVKVELEGTTYEVDVVRAGFGLIVLKPLEAPVKEPVKEKAPKKVTKKDK